MERTYIVYEGGPGITSKEHKIQATSLTEAKRLATKLFPVKGRWARTKFTDKFQKRERHGWTKGASGIQYGDHYIHMYQPS